MICIIVVYDLKFPSSDYKYDISTHKFIPIQALPNGASDLNIFKAVFLCGNDEADLRNELIIKEMH